MIKMLMLVTTGWGWRAWREEAWSGNAARREKGRRYPCFRFSALTTCPKDSFERGGRWKRNIWIVEV